MNHLKVVAIIISIALFAGAVVGSCTYGSLTLLGY